jgi:hypothetical protein
MKTVLWVVLAVSVGFKILLWSYATAFVPQSQFQPDTELYLNTGKTLALTGVFGEEVSPGKFRYEMFRTPGYSLFLGVLHSRFNIPLPGIVLIQVAMTLVMGLIIYKLTQDLAPIFAVVIDGDSVYALVIGLCIIGSTVFKNPTHYSANSSFVRAGNSLLCPPDRFVSACFLKFRSLSFYRQERI